MLTPLNRILTPLGCGGLVVAPNDITDGLKLWQRFLEVSGVTAADASGNGNDGTLTNGAAFSAGAVTFDGVDDVITTPYDLSGDSEWTISLWLKGNSPDNDILFSRGQFVGGRLGLLYNPTGGFKFQNEWQLNPSRYSWSYTLDAEWHHLVIINPATGNNIDTLLYIDGTLLDQQASGAASNPNQATLYIGGRNGTACWKGQLDDFRVYERILTSGEISTLYANGAK